MKGFLYFKLNCKILAVKPKDIQNNTFITTKFLGWLIKLYFICSQILETIMKQDISALKDAIASLDRSLKKRSSIRAMLLTGHQQKSTSEKLLSRIMKSFSHLHRLNANGFRLIN
jgi:hypothetical protein